MAESEAECFSGVKTAQNNKTEGGTETNKQKNQNVKLRKEDVPDLTSRKTRRMHRETAAEMAFLPWSQNSRKENKRSWIRLAFDIVLNAKLGEFLKFIVHKGTQKIARVVIIQNGCSTCPPPQTIPQMCARLVWVPGYLFRSELLVHNFSQPKLFSFCLLGLPFFSRKRYNHTFRLTTYNCIVLTDFQHTIFFPFQSLGFIIKIVLKYS